MTKSSGTKAGSAANALVVSVMPIELDPVGIPAPSLSERAFSAAKRAATDGVSAAVATASGAGAGLAKGAAGAGKMAGSMARGAADVGGRAAVMVGDLNGDGKIDEADFRIARESAGRAASVAAKEAGELGKAVMRHELTKDAAAGAAVGALIAVPIPLVGPAVGAAVGAAIGLTRGVVGAGMIGDVVGQVAEGIRKPQPRKTTRRKKPAPK